MTERDALLRAVCENPDDDTVRLAFADWLDENGDKADRARAEFVRVQCELAGGPEGRKRAALARREEKLLAAHKEAWEAPFRQFEVAGPGRAFVYGVHFRRGFVWGIDINDEDRRFEGSDEAVKRGFRLARDVLRPYVK